ncbi:hypothetical protein [Stenotrophomonas sp.]|uniref:hypothetical protein n=1 Tax=Stenotrophomonas sp. TaxID=69392 RepID=UPI002897BDEF|nr:hypothetical protein [Stenotrophomonas sp.]
MRTIYTLLPNEVHRQVVRRVQRLRLGVEHNSGDHASKPVLNGHLFDDDPVGNGFQADRVMAPLVHKPLLNMPSNALLIHAFYLVRTLVAILRGHPRRSKSSTTTIATITPPRDLRTQVTTKGRA